MRNFFLFLFTVGFISGFAQVKFGKVSKEELLAEKSTIDVDAPAEILSKEAVVRIQPNTNGGGFQASKEIKVRIKIYNKDKVSSKFLNVEIPAYKGASDKEKILHVRASTYNLEAGKIVHSKIRSSDIFTEEVSKYIEVQKFAFQNVKNGSVLEYKYTIKTPRVFDLDSWYFQSDIPTKYCRYYVSFPEFFLYRPDLRGSIVKKAKKSSKITKYTYKDNVEEYVYREVPALKNEPFVQNTNNLKASVRYELVEYNNPGYGYDNFATTWAVIAQDLDANSTYGGALRGNNFLNDEVNQFLNIENKKERLFSIFSHVKVNYNWDGYYGLYPENGVRKTYKEKVGNGTDINFLLISMLNKAGFTAYPVVLSTVSNGILNFFPSKRKLNHTITAVVLNQKIYLMDPIGKYSKINMLPTNDLNFFGYILIGKEKYKKVSLVNYIPSKVDNTLTYKIEGDLITGKFTQTKTNYFAMRDLIKKSNDEQNFDKKYLSDYEADFTDFSFKINNTLDAVRYTSTFEEDEAVQVIADKMFVKPLLFLSTNSNEFKFKNEERQYPLEFGTPFTFTSTANIDIPSGYIVETLPEDITIKLPQNVGGFVIKFVQKEKKIIVQSLVHVNQGILPPNFYTDIKNMFQKIIEKENEQIILKQQ